MVAEEQLLLKLEPFLALRETVVSPYTAQAAMMIYLNENRQKVKFMSLFEVSFKDKKKRYSNGEQVKCHRHKYNSNLWI